ncbi:MAG: hypothetical protein M1821_005441 [Bathelium mastoideum]|nr:MAG: hypothetical protein M1821_005441 [Bathelium mastoideum]
MKSGSDEDREKVFQLINSKEDIPRVAQLISQGRMPVGMENAGPQDESSQVPEDTGFTPFGGAENPAGRYLESLDSASPGASPLTSDAQTQLLLQRLRDTCCFHPPEPSKVPLDLPSLHEIQIALACWYTCNGVVFYTFERSEVEALVTTVHENEQSHLLGAHAAALCAVGAVGAQYSRGQISRARGMRFYQCAKLLMDNCVMESPFHTLKTAVLLAIYNALEKSIVTFTYLVLSRAGNFYHLGIDADKN